SASSPVTTAPRRPGRSRPGCSWRWRRRISGSGGSVTPRRAPAATRRTSIRPSPPRSFRPWHPAPVATCRRHREDGAMDLGTQSLTDVVEELRSRRTSPVELMEAVLARIEATRERLNAVVTVRDREALLADARAAAERIAGGEARPLEGI